MKSDYVIWDSEVITNACVLYDLKGVDKILDLKRGISKASDFPSDAAFTMNPDFPNNTLLVDNLINTDMLIVVSLRLKAFLDARSLMNVEYLPVAILDHKGKIASKKYFIVNPIEPVECLDLDKSGAKLGLIGSSKNEVTMVDRLVFDEERIDKVRELFKPKLFYRVTIATRDLAAAIDAEKFSGIRWINIEEYPER